MAASPTTFRRSSASSLRGDRWSRQIRYFLYFLTVPGYDPHRVRVQGWCMDSFPDGQLGGVGRELHRCGRCLVRFSSMRICESCLRLADADIGEKRRILLPNLMRSDELSVALA